VDIRLYNVFFFLKQILLVLGFTDRAEHLPLLGKRWIFFNWFRGSDGPMGESWDISRRSFVNVSEFHNTSNMSSTKCIHLQGIRYARCRVQFLQIEAAGFDSDFKVFPNLIYEFFASI
jgi:hypothetical protein